MQKILAIIPSRIGSTRLPRKPLINIRGKSLIQRTYESCQKSKLIDKIIVATDSIEIYDHVKSWNGSVEMTGEHSSGTTRIIEVSNKYPEYSGYLNLQGDHPVVDMEHIDSLIIKLNNLNDNIPNIVTPIVRFKNQTEINNPNVVKVVLNKNNKALYFSRSKIPYLRDKKDDDFLFKYGWKHLGLYCFNKLAINEIQKLQVSLLEDGENLEQLTWLFNDLNIYGVEVSKDTISVDVKDDLIAVENFLKNERLL